MTLTNALLAMGGLAFVVPLAIHLFYRTRYRTLAWGAMHLIDAMTRVNQRRLQWANILLLLIRCLIPVMLAFCLARPLLTGFRSLPGDAPQSVILVIDDSRSMGFADADGQSRLDRAKTAARQVLEPLTRQDQVILLRSSNLETPIIRYGTDQVADAITELRPDGGPVSLGRLMQAATDVAQQAAHPGPRVMVLSDFQTNMVGDDSLSTLQTIAAKTQQQRPGAIPPVCAWMDVSNNTASDPVANVSANVSVDAVRVDSPAAMVDRRTTFSATIRNHGDEPIENLNVIWSVDSKATHDQPVSIASRSFAEAKFQHTFAAANHVAVAATIDVQDSLAADNKRVLAVNVIDRVDVLILQSQQDLKRRNPFLQAALASFQLRTASTLDQSAPDVIVMDGVKSLDPDLKEQLAAFVHDGGGLIVFDSPDVDVEAYNQPWGDGEFAMELPAILGGPNEIDLDEADSAQQQNAQQQSWKLANRNPDYAPWFLFGDERRDLFSQVQIGGYRTLTLRDDVATKAAITLLSLQNGDPIAIRNEHGDGGVVQFAVTADTRGSTFPLRPVFVPMMQQLVLDLAGSQRRLNHWVGDPVAVDVAEFQASATGKDSTGQLKSGQLKSGDPKSVNYWVQIPGQNEQALQPNATRSGQQLRWWDTDRPGVYRFGASTGAKTIRVIEVQDSESVSETVDPARLRAAAEKIGATIFADPASLIDANQTQRYGREIWRWFWAVVVVLLLVELWLQQRLGRPSLEPA